MIRKLRAIALPMLLAAPFLSSLSCARSQQLVAVSVSPQGSTITLSQYGQQIQTQFTAYGTYIHPPETKDLTQKATWTTNSPSIISLSSTSPGLVTTTGTGCGTNLGVTASVYTDNNNTSGNVVVGSAAINVQFNGSTCP
jgi:hypothetical protein